MEFDAENIIQFADIRAAVIGHDRLAAGDADLFGIEVAVGNNLAKGTKAGVRFHLEQSDPVQTVANGVDSQLAKCQRLVAGNRIVCRARVNTATYPHVKLPPGELFRFLRQEE